VTALIGEALGDRPVFAYHAGMDTAARTNNQERFMQTPRAIAVATNAFGMGINKPDVRLVCHYNLPGTLEAYYQEAGRAGRDGLPARCVVLFNYQDRYTQEFFIDKIGEDSQGLEGRDSEFIQQLKTRAREKLELVIRYAQTHSCRRQMILDYFGDETEVSDCSCDICAGGNAPAAADAIAMTDEVTLLVRQILSGVARCNGKFGVGVVADVLAGAGGERLERWNLHNLSVFGLLRNYPAKRIIAMLHRIMEAGLARQRDPEGVKFRPVVELTATGIEVMKGSVVPPASLADLAPRNGAAKTKAATKFEQEDIILDDAAAARFEKLRAVRLRLAREKQLPSYCICHDRTLKLIARQPPTSESQLERIKGMGPIKVRLYGKAIMEGLGA
jgi:ATP-dependent DNA helicase RecQ